jgi:hypothetical protein
MLFLFLSLFMLLYLFTIARGLSSTLPHLIPYRQYTVPWFGPFCQYNFRLNNLFSDIVKSTFDDKSFKPDTVNFSCYVHLECNRGPSPLCLDWREICDGKVDCLDGGEDEKHCYELETSQCAENEYQCRNGMCVDEAFLLDDHAPYVSPECLDWTDEVLYERNEICRKNATFACEDTICRFPVEFACGDGQCITMSILKWRHDINVAIREIEYSTS